MHSYEQDKFQGQFNDSVIIHPIHMKSNINVVPSILHRGNPEHTTLATYDKFKLTQFTQLDHLATGDVLKILSIDPDSLLVSITKQGIQFFQKYSSSDITFVTVVGDKQSGKSFFIDKILNLANISGNHFCSPKNSKPGLNVWSVPFVKEQLQIFFIELSNCSTNSNQFKALAPYITLLSSAVINLNHYKQQSDLHNASNNNSLKYFQIIMKQTIQSFRTDNQNKKIQILPQSYYNINRIINKGNLPQNKKNLQYFEKELKLHIQQITLPDALNKSYQGPKQDLKSHSFLNKACISQDYIRSVSQIFQKIYNKVNQKKYRQLVFNGNIILKLIRHVEVWLRKHKNIMLDVIYKDIVNDLYISAYNYCVISYHEDLQKALQNQEPHSLESLINIFENTSKEVFQKYNQFTLDPECHREYEQKLFLHIQSKQRLMLQINKKKTFVEIQKILQKTDMSNIETAWQNVKAINQNKKYSHLNHGKSQLMGQTINKILLNTKNSNNIDYRILKQIQKLKSSIKQKETQLSGIKQKNKLANEKQFKINEQRKGLQNSLKDLQQKIKVVNRDIKIYSSHEEHNIEDLTEEQNKLTTKYERNQQLLQQLKGNENPQIQKVQKEKNRQIQAVISKQRLLQTTLQDLQKQKGAMIQSKQSKEKGEPQKQKQSKVKKQPIKNNRQVQQKQIKAKKQRGILKNEIVNIKQFCLFVINNKSFISNLIKFIVKVVLLKIFSFILYKRKKIIIMGNGQKIANKISPKLNNNGYEDIADFGSSNFLDSFQNSKNRSFIFNRSEKIGGYCITKEKLVIEKKQINKNMNVGFGVKGTLTGINEFTAESNFGATISQVFKGTQKLSTYNLNPKVNSLGLQKSDEDKYVTIWYGPNKQIVQSMVIQNHQIKKGTTIHLLLKKLNYTHTKNQKVDQSNSSDIVSKSYKTISGNMLRWYSLFIEFDNSGILHQTMKIAQTPAIKLNFRKVKNYNGGCFICGYYKDHQQNSEQFKYSQTVNMIYCNECYQSTKINLEKKIHHQIKRN